MGEPFASVGELFDQIDTGSTGSVSFAELTAWWDGRAQRADGSVALGDGSAAARVRSLAEELSDEMVPTAESHPREWAIFSQLDADGNGSLDIEEIYAYVSTCPY